MLSTTAIGNSNQASTNAKLSRVLIVDDDEQLLAGLRRTLHGEFAIETAVSGDAGLETMRTEEPFAVVVADMHMPGLNGIEFLAKARAISPPTVRIMLTGDDAGPTAIEAVNEGDIFRYLVKPCPSPKIASALRAAVTQFQLAHAERQLLSQTLCGSVAMMVKLLTNLNPWAVARATRIRTLAKHLCHDLTIPDAWQIDVAALLSHIGHIALPTDLQLKIERGEGLSLGEQRIYESQLQVAQEWVGSIPRLDAVARILALREKRFDGSGPPDEEVRGERIPLGARILKLACDFDSELALAAHASEALKTLECRRGWYDPGLLRHLRTHLSSLHTDRASR